VNITLFEEEVKLAEFKKKLVDDACVDWSGPTPEDCDPRSDCCTDGECPPNTDDPDVSVTCDRQPAAGPDGLHMYGCQSHYPDDWCLEGNEAFGDAWCDDDASFTIDECVDDRCVHRTPYSEEILGDNMATVACPTALECCYVDSDCRDTSAATVDTCVKPEPSDGPDVRGTCAHETDKVIPRF
jgi:hypothetical protein